VGYLVLLTVSAGLYVPLMFAPHSAQVHDQRRDATPASTRSQTMTSPLHAGASAPDAEPETLAVASLGLIALGTAMRMRRRTPAPQ